MLFGEGAHTRVESTARHVVIHDQVKVVKVESLHEFPMELHSSHAVASHVKRRGPCTDAHHIRNNCQNNARYT